MVSPSKLQQQSTPRSKLQSICKSKKNLEFGNEGSRTTTEAASATVRIQKGPKPLEKKIFYLDIKNYALSAKLEARIKEFGGVVELFFVKSVHLVISDKKEQSGPEKTKWGYASGESGGPPSLRSVEIPTPTPTPPTPYRSVEGPLSNSNSQRCPTTQRSRSRVDAMLERALTQPQQCSLDPLSNAFNWGIPIWTPYQLQDWLDKIAASLKESHQCSKSDSSRSKDLRVKILKEPYIKFEPYRRETRPVFAELQSWPKLHFEGDPGTCPFDVKKIKEKKDTCTINKEVKENKEKHINHNISKGKDMTRRPRAPATRARKTENTGYCEICRVDYQSLTKHTESDQHLNFVRNEKNFLSLDNLINTGANVEAFLKLNRSKDVSKDCGHFRQQAHNLDNGLLSPDEKLDKRDKSHLVDYDIEEMKMLQCNGARRNLTSSLDSSHNLRTRAKHESGHLLRSKGKTGDDDDEKGEKVLEKFVVKKRSKGILWIEENDSEDSDKDLENVEHVDYDGKPLLDIDSSHKISAKNGDNFSMNGEIDNEEDDIECKHNDNALALKETFLTANTKTKLNGYERRETKHKQNEVSHNGDESIVIKKELNHADVDGEIENADTIDENDDSNSLYSLASNSRSRQVPRRGGKAYQKPRPRLSVEERLIEDNRDYYKVEVLGNKLRSSGIPPSKEQQQQPQNLKSPKKEDNKPSSDKPVALRFKRVRKSELSLLSVEATSFMFPKSCDESSDDDSIVPKDTESDHNAETSVPILSSLLSPMGRIAPKQESNDEDSQDSINSGRTRKRRRTQTEALLKDNTDYYKFETPGSRLRFQAPLTGIKEPSAGQKDAAKTATASPDDHHKHSHNDRLYPSKPTPEIEKMHYSFEAKPLSEPWFRTYQRQDNGDEFWYSESDSYKPFLLPYEIENFHEILQRNIQNSNQLLKRGGFRGGIRGGHPSSVRTPRKSPRCHASTLAIMSTILRRREQQQDPNQQEQILEPIEEDIQVDPLEEKISEKSNIDKELTEIARNIDEMLSNSIQDSFESDLPEMIETPVGSEPTGAPINLIDLLSQYNDAVINEGSSCASGSDCSELFGNGDMSARRRKKKRKNKTGWPGIKLRRKMHLKNLPEEIQKILLKRDEKRQQGSVQKGSSHKIKQETEIFDEMRDDGPKENKQLAANSLAKGTKRVKIKGNREVIRDNSEGKSPTKLSELTPKKKKKNKQSSEEESSPKKRKQETLQFIDNSESLESSNYSSPKKKCKKNSPPRKYVKNKSPSPKKKLKKNETSSELSHPYKKIYNKKRIRSKLECRNATSSSELNDEQDDRSNSESDQQRRSSMDMQPVVRVMKIEDQVAVASNRRLRSSNSPKSKKSKKRAKNKNNRLAKRKVGGHSSKKS